MIRSGGEGSNMLLAHRISYELAYGPIPDGLNALHTCDNPPCINVEHLFLGTQQDNMDDKMAKGRQAYGEYQGSAKLSDDIIREIRRRYDAGGITQEQLGREYHVHQTVVCKAINYEIWKYVE